MLVTCFITLIIFVFYLELEKQTVTCDKLKNISYKDLPSRCIAYFNQ